MRRFVPFVIAGMVGACSSHGPSPIAPSSTTPSVAYSTPSAPAPSFKPKALVDGNYTVTGPNGCIGPDQDASWVVEVLNAGPSRLRVVTATSHASTASCEETKDHIRTNADAVKITGPRDYAPNSSGTTTFAYRVNEYACGRVQVDVSYFDDENIEKLVLGTMINYGVDCAPEPPRCPEGTTYNSHTDNCDPNSDQDQPKPPVIPPPPYTPPPPCSQPTRFGKQSVINCGPIDVCPNLEGIQQSVPQGYHFSEGGQCVPNTPPPPVDVCFNIPGNQATTPQGYTNVAGLCLPIPPVDPPTVFCHIPPGNGHNGQTLTLPLSAIQNGHIPQHSHDHYGACTANETSQH